MYFLVFFACFALIRGQYYGTYDCPSGSDVMVHLFEWTHASVADECERFLSENGFCAVQVSPPNEHRVIDDPWRPWYQRYQPVSYSMTSRSGNELEFLDMVNRCNDVGVRVYVDAVINHMTGGGFGVGSDGSVWSGDGLDYPSVPFGSTDFNGANECSTSSLEIENYQDVIQVRNCRLLGLRDLKLAKDYVRGKVAEYLNKLVGYGVAGFRVDASKHMWPGDMQNIFNRLNNLNTRWFPSNTKPFIYQEVIDMGGEPITASEYTSMGRVTEFKYGKNLGDCIRKNNGEKISYLKNFGEGWGFMSGVDAVSFVDNHDNQRGHGAGGFGSILTFFEDRWYKMANAFLLAWPYGYPRIMSSYNWPRNIVGGTDQNDWVGPPDNGAGDTDYAVCFNGDWICEHRWRQITNMVHFHNAVINAVVQNWWDNGENMIAFSRGNIGFLAMNNENYDMNEWLQTGLPGGVYCDIISGDDVLGACTGKTITVNANGFAQVTISSGDSDPMIAIYFR
ncbi:unnamed protein product [Owenia fusiformis]|uniref:alpha-amylase n=1 Tax=Owenia fusiformis TaxID=6347 RepID=A0A8J1U6C7_OWEFU|nr:unnamed protein product [Owenia fusiformis]